VVRGNAESSDIDHALSSAMQITLRTRVLIAGVSKAKAIESRDNAYRYHVSGCIRRVQRSCVANSCRRCDCRQNGSC
jgi:hypothetical protein